MLWKLDPAWLMMAISTVSVLSYFFGSALHALMREDGFGSFGNAIIISVGFFLTLAAVDSQGYEPGGIQIAVFLGLAGAFIVLSTLTFLRALLKRL